jgi:hypothetical protein
MSGRRFRNLLLLAAAAAVGWWIYKDRPSPAGLIDSITAPLLGSHAAVKTSERNRVVGDATTAITEQVELPVGSLREGMSSAEVRDLLGEPDRRDPVPEDKRSWRWTYTRAGRVLTLTDNRVVSIAIIR